MVKFLESVHRNKMQEAKICSGVHCVIPIQLYDSLSLSLSLSGQLTRDFICFILLSFLIDGFAIKAPNINIDFIKLFKGDM